MPNVSELSDDELYKIAGISPQKQGSSMPDVSSMSDAELYRLAGLSQQGPDYNYDPALPNKAKTQEAIAQRPDMLSEGVKEVFQKRSPIKGALRASTYGPLTDTLKLAAGPFQRAESAVAAPLLEAQSGNIQPKQLLKAAKRGIAGEERAELGDVIRTTGAGGRLNEPIAKGVGLITAAPIMAGVGKGMGMAGEAMVGTGEKALQASKRLPILPKSTETVIENSIRKGVRPYFSNKNTAAQQRAYFDKAKKAVSTIVDNKENLQFLDEAGESVNRLPQSLNDFRDAIEQTKEVIFKQYDALTKAAGKSGATIDLSQAANEIEKVANNKALSTLYPNVQKAALQKADSLIQAGSFTPEEAQNAIKMLNKSLEAYYRNPSPETASMAVIDAGIANNLRRSLDEVVTNATQQAYKPLKDQYAALKTIEKDVNRRAIVSGRQNQRGLIDFTDIFSGAEIVRGILNLGRDTARGSIGSGLAARAIKEAYKAANDPNRIIRNMFKVVAKSKGAS